jgi:hypothetical protein
MLFRPFLLPRPVGIGLRERGGLVFRAKGESCVLLQPLALETAQSCCDRIVYGPTGDLPKYDAVAKIEWQVYVLLGSVV